MSMIYCDNCGSAFDSDDDPECFVEDLVYCEKCRNSLEGMTEETL